MGVFKDIRDAFRFSETQIITAKNITRSPIDAAVKELSDNPQKKKIGGTEYIRFGKYDDIPDALAALIGKSSTHAGIISKKAKLIAGNLKYSGSGASGGGAKAIAWQVFSDNAGGLNYSLDKVFKRMAYLYYAYGGVGLLVKFKSKGNLVGIKAVHPRNFRLLPPDSDGTIRKVVIADSFNSSGYGAGIYTGKHRVVPIYDQKAGDKEQFIYISNPETNNEFYGLPSYIGASNFIEADYEFGVTIKNTAGNGFAPRISATFIGRSMSDEAKRQFSEKFKRNFMQADGELVVTSWVRRPEEAPKIDKLDIDNFDATIKAMSELNDAKILTAHSVTVPSLFGVVTPSKLGVSGSELRDGYSILMVTDILPARKYLLDPLQSLLRNTQFEKIKIEVENMPLTIIETRGGKNTNGDNQTVKEQNNG